MKREKRKEKREKSTRERHAGRYISSFLFLHFSFLLAFSLPVGAQEAESSASAPAPVQRSLEDRRRDILRFGTETEIATLIQTIKTENVSYLDEELVNIARNTRNRNILTGIFGFFGEEEKPGLEERAMRAIRDRDYETNDIVLAAVDYLGRVKAADAAADLQELIDSGEGSFLYNAIRALGRVASSNRTDDIALYLLDYYETRSPTGENQREVIVAMGETGSGEVVPFLVELIENPDERAVLRIAALDAVAKIEDSRALEAVVEAVSSADPLVRASAIAALGPFSGEAVDAAILEGFRDSFFRTRIGAAQAAGRRKLASAVPFLRHRAENDAEAVVRDAAIRALGAINNNEAMSVLDSLFSEQRNSDRIRILSADMLLQNDASGYSGKVIAASTDAKTRNQTNLYNGFMGVLGRARAGTLEDFARRLLDTGGVLEKNWALEMVLNNEFRGLADEVRGLLDEQRSGAALARRARNTLERLGLDAGEN